MIRVMRVINVIRVIRVIRMIRVIMVISSSLMDTSPQRDWQPRLHPRTRSPLDTGRWAQSVR